MDNKSITYSELNDWYKSIFDNFGKVILLKKFNNYDKIELYKDNIKEFKDRLEEKITKLNKGNNSYIKDDLKNMLSRINILDEYLDKYF